MVCLICERSLHFSGFHVVLLKNYLRFCKSCFCKKTFRKSPINELIKYRRDVGVSFGTNHQNICMQKRYAIFSSSGSYVLYPQYVMCLILSFLFFSWWLLCELVKVLYHSWGLILVNYWCVVSMMLARCLRGIRIELLVCCNVFSLPTVIIIYKFWRAQFLSKQLHCNHKNVSDVFSCFYHVNLGCTWV